MVNTGTMIEGLNPKGLTGFSMGTPVTQQQQQLKVVILDEPCTF